ncbi:MAG: glycosyltransferase [Isosphaeraceae bacterium]|nr:glycosyltransferase [Isosphaeraceae bacterium]
MEFGLRPMTATERHTSSGTGRVLLLSTNMGKGGGAEEQVIALAYGLQARGWEARIVSLLPPSPMPPGFEERGIPLVDLGMRPGSPDPRALRRLGALVREFRPSVIHSHMVHANLLARAVRLLEPYPVLVCTHHNLTMAGVRRNWTGLFEVAHRLTDGLAEHATAICHAAADYYVRRGAVPAFKMSVVPNGIECDRYRPDPEARARLRHAFEVDDRFVWLAVGRLETQKAYPTMLHAFARLGDGRRTLLVCGKGSRRDELAALVDALGIGDRVQFLGLRDDIPSLLSVADGFCLSSDLEGLPLVLLQASAAALPIVATDVGGNGEVVVDGVSGYLCAAGDPGAFAENLARVEALPASERAALGLAGQDRVRGQFEAERVFDRWEMLYRELLAHEGGAARWPRRRALASVAGSRK